YAYAEQWVYAINPLLPGRRAFFQLLLNLFPRVIIERGRGYPYLITLTVQGRLPPLDTSDDVITLRCRALETRSYQPRLPRGAFRFLALPNTATVPSIQDTVLGQVAGDLGKRPTL